MNPDSPFSQRRRSRAQDFGYGLLGSIVSLAVVSVVVVIAMDHMATVEWQPSDQQLVSLRDPVLSQTGGSFFLGTGTISTTGETYYAYYVQENGGAFIAHTMTGKDIRVYEEARSDAVLRTWCERWIYSPYPAPWLQLWPPGTRYICDGSKEFHVPNGTIRREYHLG